MRRTTKYAFGQIKISTPIDIAEQQSVSDFPGDQDEQRSTLYNAMNKYRNMSSVN